MIAVGVGVGYAPREARMPGLDFTELLLVGILILLFVGPERMPHVVRMLGRLYGQFRRSADEFRKALVLEADRMDEEERLRALVRQRKEAEARRQAEQASGAEADPSVGTPQPQPQSAPSVVTPSEARDPAAEGDGPPDLDGVPEGFSEDEWATLPESVKLLVRQRQGAT